MRILLIDIDTLRPDHLGCYGYHRNTSPHIDALAAEGVRFDQYYCSDAPCLPSRMALVSGRPGIHTGAVNHGGLCAEPRPQGAGRWFRDRLASDSLWATARRAGLHTASISPFGERHAAWWFYAGLNELHNTGEGGNESGETITPLALDWLARRGASDNWLLHVNYWDPHTPYRAPASFGDPFRDDPLPGWITDEALVRHMGMAGPHCAREINMYDNAESPDYPRQPGEVVDRAGLRRLFDGYDTGIRHADAQVGLLLAELERLGIAGDTAVMVTSDHGENMGELGIYAEHATADAATCRIPLIVRWPGAARGAIAPGLHVNFDFCPTLGELLALDPAPTWEGRSFAGAVRGPGDPGREHIVLSQCAHVCQRAVRQGPWLWMRTWHDGYHLFPGQMLFNLAGDPHEQHDLASERPEIAREMASLYNAWHAEAMAAMPEGWGDPLDTVLAEGGPFHARGQLARYCERLKATGRAWAIDELRRRHPREA